MVKLNVYQARNGALYLRNGTRVARLTYRQISDLRLSIFDVEDHDFDSYKEAYKAEKARDTITIP